MIEYSYYCKNKPSRFWKFTQSWNRFNQAGLFRAQKLRSLKINGVHLQVHSTQLQSLHVQVAFIFVLQPQVLVQGMKQSFLHLLGSPLLMLLSIWVVKLFFIDIDLKTFNIDIAQIESKNYRSNKKQFYRYIFLVFRRIWILF